ncbi:Caspase domain-containing protein [Flaviramulus basaltis]|uniref:Caspase domain-containing protein n=1 Tax=Flaviramulus basaltis TaxID=369401 RepID=A0A1K2IKR1_9FLAO|nr:caspase family protein [Flaviramulus basaltis]SFZ93025.1 Caspase domain-containing protein [Flaviramulus basaltis]
MKQIFLILILFFYSSTIYAEKYALIVAVGNYPKSTGWSTIHSLNDVPLIKQTLLDQEFKENNISLLTDEAATYSGIKNALNELLKVINPNDIVVIHFSMHGQQIFDNNGDEIDGKDEALVPYDAWVKYNHNYKGENHFRDDELGTYITMFRNSLQENGQLLLLLDSCHSGSSSRGGLARGSKAVFAPDGWKSTSNIEDSGSGLIENVDNSKVKLNVNAAPYILISGASANELNYEYKGVGSLSYTFTKAMNKLGSNYSFNQLFAKIETEMNIISPYQNPTIEGNINAEIFNNAYIKQQPFYKVKSVLRDDVIRIQSGKIHGLFENTTVFVTPSGTSKASKENIITSGTILNSKFNECTIKLDEPLENSNEKKYWVFIDKPSYGDMFVNVFFDESVKDKSIKAGVSNFLNENELGEVAKYIDSADVVLMQKGNSITLNSPNGLQVVDKDEENIGSSTIEEINQTLFAFAQGQYLKNLDLKNYNYEFEFKLIPNVNDSLNNNSTNDIKIRPFVNQNGTFQVIAEKDEVVLQVTNKSNRVLYFCIIEINSKGEIASFMPNDDYPLMDDERKLMPGQTETFKHKVYEFLPPYEKLILKGFATPYPINFKTTVDTRGESSRSTTNPLEDFLGNTYTPSRGSTGKKANPQIDGFTFDFVYEIIKE